MFNFDKNIWPYWQEQLDIIKEKEPKVIINNNAIGTGKTYSSLIFLINKINLKSIKESFEAFVISSNPKQEFSLFLALVNDLILYKPEIYNDTDIFYPDTNTKIFFKTEEEAIKILAEDYHNINIPMIIWETGLNFEGYINYFLEKTDQFWINSNLNYRIESKESIVYSIPVKPAWEIRENALINKEETFLYDKVLDLKINPNNLIKIPLEYENLFDNDYKEFLKQVCGIKPSKEEYDKLKEIDENV